MLGKTKTVDWIAEAEAAKKEAAEIRASVKPARESWAEAQRELDQLSAALAAAGETIHSYRFDGATQVTEAEYKDAVEVTKELQVKIAELRPIVDHRRAEADSLGRKAHWRAQGIKQELTNRLKQAQQDELKAVMDTMYENGL